MTVAREEAAASHADAGLTRGGLTPKRIIK
jgi:hypothetical protein